MSLFDFFPLFDEDEDEIRARLDADANAGVDPDSDEWIDPRPLGMFHDTTQPTVLEFARLWDALAIEVPAAAFILCAWGDYLDEHAAVYQLTRESAIKATGTVLLTGTPGTVIAAFASVGVPDASPDVESPKFVTTEGGVVATQLNAPTGLGAVGSNTGGALATATYYYTVTAINEVGETIESSEANSGARTGPSASVALDWNDVTDATGYRIYRSTTTGNEKYLTEVVASNYVDVGSETPTTDDPPASNTTGGKARVAVEAVVAGSAGNVSAAAITEILSPISSITAVTNDEATENGADDETDDELRDRLLLEFKAGGPGNATDHARWALDWPGVGRVTIFTVYQGVAGQVGVALFDADGRPVSSSIVEDYQDWIDPLPGQSLGQAPPGQTVIVYTPTEVSIDVVAAVDHDDGYSLDGTDGTIPTRASIVVALREYLNSLEAGEDVVYNHVQAQFFTVPGINDVTSLTIEAGSSDVSITDIQSAILAEPPTLT